MADEPKDLYIDPIVTPNVVPASFTPDPQTFEVKLSAELRSQQAKLARDFVEGKINAIDRTIQKNKRQVGSEIVAFTPPELEAQIDLAYTYRVVQTKLSQNLADFADVATLEALDAALPEIFERLVDQVLRDRYPERYEAADPLPAVNEGNAPTVPSSDEEVPALADEPTEVISPPIPMPTLEEAIDGVEDISLLEMPDDELNLGDVLGKISDDNAS